MPSGGGGRLVGDSGDAEQRQPGRDDGSEGHEQDGSGHGDADQLGARVGGLDEARDDSLGRRGDVRAVRGVIFWSRLHGLISLELGGHLASMQLDPELLYRAELAELGGQT